MGKQHRIDGNTAMAESAHSMEEVEERAARKDEDREIYWYTMPERIATSTGISEMGFVELTTGEQIMATRRAANNPANLALELLMQSIRYINRKLVHMGDGSVEAYMNQQKRGMATVVQLALGAYGQIHNPQAGEAVAFLSSRKITTGLPPA